MKKIALLIAAAMIGVPLKFVVASPVTAATPHDDRLPGVDGSGASLPLKPAQLTAQERKVFAKLRPNSDDARRFLFARGYLRYSQRVVDQKLDPSRLPDLPAKKDWDGSKFFSKAERGIVDVALGRKIVSQMKANLSPSPAMIVLTPDQLNPDEEESFAKLPVDSDDARRFLHTRSYLRPCKAVVDGSLEPLRLPALPEREDWDRKFLSEAESKQVVDVCLGMKMMAMMK